jgi:hypothetical protein
VFELFRISPDCFARYLGDAWKYCSQRNHMFSAPATICRPALLGPNVPGSKTNRILAKMIQQMATRKLNAVINPAGLFIFLLLRGTRMGLRGQTRKKKKIKF